MKFLSLFVFAILLSACSHIKQQNTRVNPISFVKMDYTNMFGIANFKEYSQLFFINGRDTNWSIKSNEIKTNLKVAVLSSVFAGYIEYLNKQDQIIAVDKFDYYCDSMLRSRIKDDKVIEIGEEGQINISKLMMSKPDLIICSSFTSQDKSLLIRLNNSGIKLVFCDNFKEQNPLARAEWLKMFGFLFGTQEESINSFNNIVDLYNGQIKNLDINFKKPLVLTDALYADVWNVPGGNSYTSKLIEDANGLYVFSEKKDLFSYPLSLELVLKKAENCDIWLHVNQYKSKAELFKANTRYGLLKVFQESRIFNNNKRENQFGGNDFWEMGVVRPDIILHDLMTIFKNPNISEAKLYFYTRVD